MNQATPASPFSPGPLVLTGLIVAAVLARLLPHPPNFSPVEAVALFGGAYFASRLGAVLVPMIAMALSDVALAWFNGGEYLGHLTSLPMLSIYLCIVLSSVMGFGLRSRVSGARVLGYSLAGSVLFFLVTNAAVWVGASTAPAMSGACGIGLMPCYAAGIPFFQWTIAGTLFYAALLFGSFALLRNRMSTLRPQTV